MSKQASETRWTAGPWRASETYPLGDFCIHAPTSPWQLAYLRAHPKEAWPLKANANLIAAAPSLYDVAVCLRQHLALFCGPDDAIANEIFRIADAALASARGEA